MHIPLTNKKGIQPSADEFYWRVSMEVILVNGKILGLLFKFYNNDIKTVAVWPSSEMVYF